MRKPLIWELVRDTERFQFISGEKVEHIVINMTSLDKIQDDIWWDHFTSPVTISAMSDNFQEL